MSRWFPRLLTLLVVCLCPASLVSAEDASPPKLSEVKAAFLAATDASGRAKALARLEGREPKAVVRLLRQWLRNHEREPLRASAIARAFVAWDATAAARAIRSTLLRKQAAPSRMGLLRVAWDVPDLQGRHHLKSWKDVEDDAVLGVLARQVQDPDGETEPPLTDAYGVLQRVHDATRVGPGITPTWQALVPVLRALQDHDPLLFRTLIPRLLGRLPVPDAATLAHLPDAIVKTYADLLLPDAIAARTKSMSLDEVRALTGRVRAEGRPALLEALIGALDVLPPWSLERREVYATLLELSGADIPDDAAFWRSWWVGNRERLVAMGTLSVRRTLAAAIARGVNALMARQAEDGSFPYHEGRGGDEFPDDRQDPNVVGATALAAFALSAAAVPPTAPVMQKALRYLRASQGPRRMHGALASDYTYAISLAIMAMQSISPRRELNTIEQLTLRLAGSQIPTHGGWTYRTTPVSERSQDTRIDLSNTQYAILGLRRAALVGIPTPKETWTRVLALMRKAEIKETGDWVYYVPSPENFGVRKGMSAIAAASLLIAMNQLDPKITRAEVLADEQVDRALRAMARRYGNTAVYGRMDLYTMYSVERVGALYGIAAFAGVPWHATAEDTLLRQQNDDGSWGSDPVKWWTSWGKTVDTAYALLILKKATTPVFAGGLNVPVDPKQPIAPWKGGGPKATLPPPAAKGEPAAMPIESRIAAESALAEARGIELDALWGLFAEYEGPVDRLAITQAIAELDPHDVRAQLYRGHGLGSEGTFTRFTEIAAALPVGTPDTELVQRMATLRKRGAERAYRRGMKQPAGSAVRAALHAYVKKRDPSLLEVPPMPSASDAAPARAKTRPDVQVLEGPMLVRIREELATPPPGIVSVPQAQRTPKDGAFGHRRLCSRHVCLDVHAGIEDAEAILRRTEADIRLLGWLVGLPGVERVPALQPRLRIVARGRGDEERLEPEQRASTKTVRAVREVFASDAAALARELRILLLADFLPELMAADVGPRRRATSALRNVLHDILADGELGQPLSMMPRYAPADVDGDLLTKAMDVELDNRGRPLDKDVDPRLMPLAFDVVHWLVIRDRTNGLPLLQRLWQGQSFAEAVRGWPGGAEDLARRLQKHLTAFAAR